MKLNIINIKHDYSSVRFVYDAEIKNGITGVFGYSGSGKTTLMNIISGIETPKSGRLEFNDRVFFDSSAEINIPANQRNIGVVFQDNYLFPHLTIKKNLLYSSPYIKNKKTVMDFDSVVDLLDIKTLLDKKPYQLSGGERQRSAIGRALLSQPEMLLLDEPFSNLDRKRREQIISYLLRINNKYKIPLIIISHDLEDILKLTQYLLIIDKGRIEASGNYYDLMESGTVRDIIPSDDYKNILELTYSKYLEDEKLYAFSLNNETDSVLLKTTINKPGLSLSGGETVRFAVSSSDIVLTMKDISQTSIQNHIKGSVKKISCRDDSCYVTVDCGIDLVAELSRASVNKMKITKGDEIYCLIKAKAVDLIHIYKNRSKEITDERNYN